MNPNVFRNMSYGLYIVGTQDAANNRPTGCIVNSVMQITSTPATIAISVNHDNYTNACIRSSGMFSVSILSEQCDPAVIGKFGFRTGRDTDKFAGISYEKKLDMPVLKSCCGYLVCKVISTMEASTHTVFLGEVADGDTMLDETPMTYVYYHKVVKGKTPKNASTYIAEEKKPQEKPAEKKVIWRCTLCGYQYVGEIPFEQLPNDYVCPLCGATKDMFEKIEA
jgi:flavin reductase (DIM6/NTAB) family NADH-FMN oxidoreductase RutF/rubredoxin